MTTYEVFAQLDRLMNMSLVEKVAYAEACVEKQINDSSVVACSFGKDSMVVLYFARMVKRDVKVVWSNTGVEYPEVSAFVKKIKDEWKLNLEILTPNKNFWECIRDYGWPRKRVEYKDGRRTGHSSPRCCHYLKEYPMQKYVKLHPEFDRVFLGLTAEESRQRKLLFMRNKGSSCYFDNSSYGRPILKVNPIMPWRSTDVWQFIKQNDIPICPSYEKWNIPRLGCWPCTSHLGWKEQLLGFAPNVYRRAMREKEGQLILEYYLGDATK